MRVLRVVGIVVLSLLFFAGACSDDGGRPNPDTVGPDGPVADGPAGDGSPDAGGVGPGTWVMIPPTGTAPVTFTMGSPPTEPCRDTNEDQHQVTLTHTFEIQSTEVTQGEFLAVMGYNPSFFSSCGTSCPVENVNWHGAVAYCNALSAQKGFEKCYSCSGTDASVICSDGSSYSGQKIYDCPGYRLPTEAEWEYACRAGTTTAYYSGATDPTTCNGCKSPDPNADKIGWYCINSGDTTHPVGQKAPNAWGLYDMAGNVGEWCHDWHQDDLGSSAVTDPWGAASGLVRGIRGGCLDTAARYLRSAARHGTEPTGQGGGTGVRCVRTLTP